MARLGRKEVAGWKDFNSRCCHSPYDDGRASASRCRSHPAICQDRWTRKCYRRHGLWIRAGAIHSACSPVGHVGEIRIARGGRAHRQCRALAERKARPTFVILRREAAEILAVTKPKVRAYVLSS